MRLLLRPLLLLCLGLLAACSQPEPPFLGAPLAGSSIAGGDFTLTDHNGQPRRLSDFRNKVVLLFFGYTHCPDVCPTTLLEVQAALKELGAAGRDVQPLFVSLDPERDTPAALKPYLAAFKVGAIGLTGSPAELAPIARRYAISYEKNGSGEHYTVDHSAGSYLLDRQGKLRVMVNYGAGSQVLAHDLRLLLAER